MLWLINNVKITIVNIFGRLMNTFINKLFSFLFLFFFFLLLLATALCWPRQKANHNLACNCSRRETGQSDEMAAHVKTAHSMAKTSRSGRLNQDMAIYTVRARKANTRSVLVSHYIDQVSRWGVGGGGASVGSVPIRLIGFQFCYYFSKWTRNGNGWKVPKEKSYRNGWHNWHSVAYITKKKAFIQTRNRTCNTYNW